MNVHTATWLRRHCARPDLLRTHDTIRYHQARNAAARNSRIKHRKRRTKELIAL